MALDVAFTVVGLLRQSGGAVVTVATVGMWLLLICADGCLLVRRRYPLMVLSVAVAASIPVFTIVNELWLHGIPDSADPWMPTAAPIAAYSAIVYSRNRTATWVLLTGLAVVIARPWEPSLVTTSTGIIMAFLPAVLGMYVAARRRLISALTDRAERAEREKWLLAEQARTEERLRLASEMHDVVSHRVSLMVLQAGALRVATSDPTTSVAAEELRSAGNQALEELRDLIGVLRTGPAPESELASATLEAMPDLTQLVAQARSAGMEVELDCCGDPARVTAAVGRAAYRVVQEGLTNAGKHAPGARVWVRVRYSPDRVAVAVANDAADQPPGALSQTGSGTGLAGLRQRVELLGGTLASRADKQEGFIVEAVFPNHVPTHVGTGS